MSFGSNQIMLMSLFGTFETSGNVRYPVAIGA
jgi:hypothetical protein